MSNDPLPPPAGGQFLTRNFVVTSTCYCILVLHDIKGELLYYLKTAIMGYVTTGTPRSASIFGHILIAVIRSFS